MIIYFLIGYSLVVVMLSLVCGFIMLWNIPFISSSADITIFEEPRQVSLIIPAYNEAKRLPVLLESLARQDYQPHQILVVDDHSDDETAQVAKAYGADVISSLQLYKGWIGKSRACWSGALRATGQWLLFLDADVFFERTDSLRTLLIQFQSNGAEGILSVQPYHEVKKPYESLSAIFNIILLAGMSVFTPWGNKLRGTGAFGPCILCDKKQYFQSGGHQTIRSAVMDDLELGRAFEKKGWHVHCYGGKGLLRFRMYPDGFCALVEGWTKNFATASRSTHSAVMVMIIIWVTGGLSAVILLAAVLASGDLYGLTTACALYFAFCLQMIWHARRAGNFCLAVLILYPVSLVFFTILFLWSLIKTNIFHSVSWRGRKIDV